ncbi:phage holin, LL-H family [Streptococcus pneumoniae]|nr:phage holin, LL-H family [Streptococcus pneumoniae]
MQQITEIIIAFATSFLTVAVGGIVKAVKDYLLRKGGEKAVIIAEILAKNAVAKVRAELTKYNISMTDKDLDTFVESAVKQMNDAWKGR